MSLPSIAFGWWTVLLELGDDTRLAADIGE